jgi:hypothetical protein
MRLGTYLWHPVSNYLWFWPSDAWHALTFLSYALIPLSLFLAVFLLGERFPGRRRELRTLAAFLMPLLGLAYPMIGHTGDGNWEILQYLAGARFQFKAGEELGTLPLHVLARWLGPFSVTSAIRLFCLIAAAVAGPGLLFLLKQICVMREKVGAPTLSWPLSLTVICQPIVLMYAGFLQTTFLLACVAPWVVGLLIRATTPDADQKWRLLAAVALGCAFLIHGVALTAIVAFLLFWLAFSIDQRSHLAGITTHALAVVAVLAITVVAGERTVYALAQYRHWQVYRDPWTVPVHSIWDKWMALQHLLNGFPAWLWANAPCIPGQPTTFFSVDWLLLTGAAVFHVVSVPALVWAGAALPSSGRMRWLFLGCLASCLGFIAVYGPHYSYPGDLDVILFPGFLLTVVVVGVGFREDGGGAGSRREWLVFVYSVVCLSGIWGLQYSYDNASASGRVAARQCQSGGTQAHIRTSAPQAGVEATGLGAASARQIAGSPDDPTSARSTWPDVTPRLSLPVLS